MISNAAEMKDQTLTQRLIEQFEHHLSYYESNTPFARPVQLRTHRKTIDLRLQLGSAAGALADDTFLASLVETLQAWGVGSHNTVLVEPKELRRQLMKRVAEITALEGVLIDNVDAATGEQIWRIICSLDIVLSRETSQPTQSKLVGGSKALHHLLPELMPPIDRTYTAPFLGRMEPHHFQNPVQEAKTFGMAFESFRAIARSVNPTQYVGRHPWNTSRSKVIDNAIVGYVAPMWAEAKKRATEQHAG